MAQLTGFGLMNTDMGQQQQQQQLEQQQQQQQQQQLSMSPGGFGGAEKPYVKILEQPAENKLRFR